MAVVEGSPRLVRAERHDDLGWGVTMWFTRGARLTPDAARRVAELLKEAADAADTHAAQERR